MKKIKSIQLKAAFLLIVFSLNTIIGFACAVGMDMGFNSNRHEEEVTNIPVNVHAVGNQHQPNEFKNHHEEAGNQLQKKTNDGDNCCHGKVMQIAHQDKVIVASISLTNPTFFTAFISSFYDIEILLSTESDSHIKYFVQRHHPPIRDIRIAIQSFQI